MLERVGRAAARERATCEDDQHGQARRPASDVARQLEANPAVLCLGLVAKEGQAAGVVAEDQVRPAVVVVVGPGQAAAHALLVEIGTRLRRYIAKPPVAVAQKQLRLLCE